MDPKKTLRLVKAVNQKSDVFIISQALAANQLRCSGVNFFQENGKVGITGKNLEKFLNKFNRTVYPYQEIKLPKDTVIPRCRFEHISVYNTEIAQCYPGKKIEGKGDRQPNIHEITNCINQGFLLKEIELMKPKLLLLMGKLSRDNFFKYILKVNPPSSLSSHISNIVQNRKIPQFPLIGRSIYILPIQHASGANPQFSEMVSNEKLIELINGVLE